MPIEVLLIPLIVAPIAFICLEILSHLYYWWFKRKMKELGIDIWR